MRISRYAAALTALLVALPAASEDRMLTLEVTGLGKTTVLGATVAEIEVLGDCGLLDLSTGILEWKTRQRISSPQGLFPVTTIVGA